MDNLCKCWGFKGRFDDEMGQIWLYSAFNLIKFLINLMTVIPKSKWIQKISKIQQDQEYHAKKIIEWDHGKWKNCRNTNSWREFCIHWEQSDYIKCSFWELSWRAAKLYLRTLVWSTIRVCWPHYARYDISQILHVYLTVWKTVTKFHPDFLQSECSGWATFR